MGSQIKKADESVTSISQILQNIHFITSSNDSKSQNSIWFYGDYFKRLFLEYQVAPVKHIPKK